MFAPFTMNDLFSFYNLNIVYICKYKWYIHLCL